MLLKSVTLPKTLRKGVEALVAFNMAVGMWVSWIHTEPSLRPMKVMCRAFDSIFSCLEQIVRYLVL